MPKSILVSVVALALLAGASTTVSSAPVRAATPGLRSSILSPNPSSTNNGLASVSADSATDAWAVGSYSDDTTGAIETLILHWDGTRVGRLGSA